LLSLLAARWHIPGMALPRVQPIRPTWRKEPFDHPEWVFDVKYDGFRGLCYVEQGRGHFISRNGNLLSRCDVLAEQVASLLDVDDAVIDGEIIVADETGRPQFYDLLRGTRTPAYVAFDIVCRPAVFAAPRAPAGPAGDSAEGLAGRMRGAVGHRPRLRAVRSDVRQRPRGHRRQAPRRSLRPAHQMAEDQKSQLHAEGGQGRLVQWTTAEA
jgi:ATP dependent DNA ligase domain